VDGGASAAGVTLTLAVLVALAAGLLIPAGIAKLRAPGVARTALGLPRRAEPWVRVLGVAELGLAVTVLATAMRPAVAVLGLAYVAFTAVAVRQRSRGESCGCFGASDTPTGWHHVLLDGVAALSVITAAVLGVPSARVLLGDAPFAGAPLVVAGAIAVVSLQLLITALPDLATARRTAGGSA
jgi:hypothetical protein